MTVSGTDQGQPANQADLISNPASSPINPAALWRYRWLVLIVVVIFCSGGLIYLTQAQKMYSSSARVLVEQRGMRILNENEPFLNDQRIFYFTQCEIMRSTPIVSRVVDSQAVRQMPTFANNDRPVAAIQAALAVSVPKDSQVITVTFTSPHPEDTPKIVNGVVDAYLDYRAGQRKSSAAEVLKILEKEKERRDIELDAAQKALFDYRKANGMMSFETNGSNIVTQRLAELSRQVTQAEVDAIEADALRSAAANAGKDTDKLRQLVQDNSKISFAELEKGESDLLIEYNTRQRAIIELRLQYGPGHQLVKKAQSDLDGMKQDLAEVDARLAVKYQSAIAQRVEIANHRLDDLKKSFDEQQKAALELNTQSAEFSKLDSDAKRLERLCDIIDTRIKELNITEDGDAVSASFLEVGRTGTLVSPLPWRVLPVTLVLGTFFGVGLTLILAFFDKRVRSIAEVKSVVGLQPLGLVPHIAEKRSNSLRGQIVSGQSKSEVAEAYRTLRTTLFFRAGSSGAKTLLVTSPTMGDGKTMTASNLAIAVAQSGTRTLLIDADLRRPMQHRIFEIENRRGLTNLISGDAEFSQVVQRTGVAGLDVITSGPVPSNPAEVLNGQPFRDLLAELAKNYDLVIIDSPPIMPVTDARILAAICDVTVIVLRALRSDLNVARHAKEALQEVGAHVAGAIVNDVPRKGGFYGSPTYYGQYYGYGHAPKNDAKSASRRSAPGNGSGDPESAHSHSTPTSRRATPSQLLE
jgi:capsular exopolysaccharide synthesis family protein